MKSISSIESSSMSHKIKAMKRYRREWFVYNFVLYSLTCLITCSVFFYSFLFPPANHFLSHDLLNDLSFLFNPKCAFFVGNLIVFILVGDCKLWGTTPSCSPSQVKDIYNEYITRTLASYAHMTSSNTTKVSIRSPSVRERSSEMTNRIEKRKKREMTRMHKGGDVKQEEPKVGKMRACKSESEIVKIVEESLVERSEEDKYYDMPRDELNKRVEAFIARVNKQRLLELS